MRKWISFNCADKSKLLNQLLQFAEEFEHSAILSDEMEEQIGCYKDFKDFNLLAGFGALNISSAPLSTLDNQISNNDWHMGFLSYDLKDELHPYIAHTQLPRITFPNLFFFQPRWMIKELNGNFQLGYNINYNSEQEALKELHKIQSLTPNFKELNQENINLNPSLSKLEYINTIKSIQKHIQRGDIYEMNYCMEYSADNCNIIPGKTFLNILKKAPMPFSSFMKMGCKYVLSASPERYLKKIGSQILSMPMKGTAPRGKNKEDDNNNLQLLIQSVKERAENVMITDLVRNDLSMIASKNSVKVLELCKAYPFANVFQVVSTISATMKNKKEWTKAIATTFPMGSMTGAPKLRSMQLIADFEKRQRGIFSGAIGYISPTKDFDFNVIIRTLLYDNKTKTLSYSAGSAITALSDPLQEYKECQLKAATIKSILSNK